MWISFFLHILLVPDSYLPTCIGTLVGPARAAASDAASTESWVLQERAGCAGRFPALLPRQALRPSPCMWRALC